jgi:uncharacterized protein
MSERIHEILLITQNADGSPHIAPMGLRQRGELWLLAPFRPSGSLTNLQRTGVASVNTTDDVRVYAGCLSGHFDWPLTRCEQIDGLRLSNALSHRELKVEQFDDDAQRPQLLCRQLAEFNHRPFQGYNRAQSAVLELAILVSRLHMLPQEKINAEIAYLRIAIDKTAGESELEAWNWLMTRVESHRARHCA